MKEVVYTHYPDSLLPFYLYQQPYWDKIPMKRTIVPLHPFKETQLPPNVRKKLMHIPIKFNDYPDLQVAEFFYSKTSSSFSECENIDKACYCQLPKSNGEMAYFCTDIFCFSSKTIPPTCKKCRFDCSYLWNKDSKQKRVSCDRLSPEHYSFTPTVAIISDRDVVWHHKMLEWDFFRYLFVLPLIMVSSKRISYDESLFSVLSDEKIEKQFNNCRSMFELQLNYHFPYALIFNEQIKKFLAKHYELTDSEITIDQKTYRYFMHENIEADMQEILTLAQQPYRGQKVPYILSKKEMKALKQKEKKQSNE
ncbi:MAG: hypothetical protein PHR53_08995, partial [Bacteroidales bacterium]|nr:hypothetical protein [Bacteroidales bacterium]